MSDVERAARAAILTLLGYDSGIRACAILSERGEQLASSAEVGWARAVKSIWAAVVAHEARSPVEVAVAGPGGELIAVRDCDGAGMTAVALVDRHALGSLVSSDLRAALRAIRERGG